MTATANRLSIGIVGLGPVGIVRAEILAAMGHELIGVDAEADTRERFADRFNAETYEDMAEMYVEEPDVLVITLPTKFHEPVVLPAFERDVHVYMEKPLAQSLDSAETIAEASKNSDSICMVAYYHQFISECSILKSYIDAGYFGEISHIRGTYVMRRNVPRKGSWFTSDSLAGGGVVQDKGSFMIALLLHFMDYPEVEMVDAETWTDFGTKDGYAYLSMFGETGNEEIFDVEDSAIATIRFENGGKVTLDIAWAANVREQHTHTYDVRGTEAGAALDITDEREQDPERSDKQLQLFEARNADWDHLVDSTITTEPNDPIRDQLQYMIDVISGERPHDTNNVRQALQVQRIIDSMYE